MALAATHAPSDLPLAVVPSVQWALWHAAVPVFQKVIQKCASSHCVDKQMVRVELFVCNCWLAGDVLSTQAGQGAVKRRQRGAERETENERHSIGRASKYNRVVI